MKGVKRKGIIVGVIGILLVGSGITIFASEFGKVNKEKLLEATNENPFIDRERKEGDSIKSEDIYAKGKDIIITKDEMKFQKKMFEAYGAAGTDEEAFHELCRYKSELNEALSLGYTTSDEELEEESKFMTDLYNEMDETDEKNEIFESYGGIEDYLEETKSLRRDKIAINKYWNDRREELNIGKTIEENNAWLDLKKTLEQELITKQEIVIVDEM